jgi:UDP-2,3-diacylglucosamine hydrolase
MPEFDRALIISDLHLTAAYPFTASRFIDFCKNEARQVQAVFIIGDLFEFWVGDDSHLHTPFNHDIAKEIHF